MPDYLSVDIARSLRTSGIALQLPCGIHGAEAHLTRRQSLRLARDICRLLDPLTASEIHLIASQDDEPVGNYSAPLSGEQATDEAPTPRNQRCTQ